MADSQIHVALAGNPNCGKTTLFNLITGANGYVGNWPGVTVEKKEAKLLSDKNVTITDLPGIYSLSPYSPEEQCSRDYLMSGEPDVVVQVVDATNLNWSETYTALQQKTVEGQENPLPAIDAASVQEVQPYCSMWNAIYDCLFFCINGDIYDSMTPEQQEVIDECGRLATQYEREINRACDDEIMNRWQNENGVTITNYEDMDIDSFKQAVDGVDEWYQKELEGQGYDDAKELIETFTK